MYTDTIAAIASGLSNSGISVIRISGAEAFTVADKIFKASSGVSVPDLPTHSVTYGFVVCEGKTLDEVLLLKMDSPRTYTCEDVIEIDCHGGIVVTRLVLEAVLKAGARLAEPGEFTKRAFLNGRIDLSQAEAVSDIIAAGSELSLKNSISQLKGSIKEKIASLRDRILSKTAYIEAALDDPEHISLDGFGDELAGELKEIGGELRKLIISADDGRIIREGINTVLLGKPNAGKSSLLNALLGQDRAIVTDIAGTTRDTLEETVLIDGILLKLVDTAGLRNTDNAVEKIGVERAHNAASVADLILYVIDTTAGLAEEDIAELEKCNDKKKIILLNKTDATAGDCSELRQEIIDKCRIYADSDYSTIIECSAVTGQGIEKLKQTVRDMFYSGLLEYNDNIYITNARQKKLLEEALESINNVNNSLEAGMPEDFLTIDMMAAYTSLGLITGDNLEDDLADKIFSDFCMGK